MTRKIQAAHLSPSDFFSYVGSFKIYRALTRPKPDESYPGKVIFQVTDGAVRDNMDIRLNQKCECYLHEDFGDTLPDR
jgi:hypothetical protein